MTIPRVCVCVCPLPLAPPADMILHRYVVSRVIWAYMLSIGVTYSITLCLFPGLESEIRNDTLGEWLPILIMATFNMSDFVGKVSLHPRAPGIHIRTDIKSIHETGMAPLSFLAAALKCS